MSDHVQLRIAHDRIADLEAEVARLKAVARRRLGFRDIPCATCNGEGVVYPPAIFGEPVPESAGEECSDCFGCGTDRHSA